VVEHSRRSEASTCNDRPVVLFLKTPAYFNCALAEFAEHQVPLPSASAVDDGHPAHRTRPPRDRRPGERTLQDAQDPVQAGLGVHDHLRCVERPAAASVAATGETRCRPMPSMCASNRGTTKRLGWTGDLKSARSSVRGRRSVERLFLQPAISRNRPIGADGGFLSERPVYPGT